MAKMLVVLAHPELAQSRVNAAWVEALNGSEDIRVHDLYARYPDGGIDIACEQALLEEAECIVLQFPLQWYNCPPLLKQWLDDVLAQGWAYGDGGTALEGKTLCIAVSTWSRESDYRKDGRYRRTIEELTSPFEVTAMRVGMHYRPGYFVHGVGDLSDGALGQSARGYRAYLEHFLM